MRLARTEKIVLDRLMRRTEAAAEDGDADEIGVPGQRKSTARTTLLIEGGARDLQEEPRAACRVNEAGTVAVVGGVGRLHDFGGSRIATRYEIDGVHFDYVRYPTQDFDYSRDALAAFRASIVGELSPEDRRRYDARVAGGEPLI